MPGGKSRKTGRVSKELINKILGKKPVLKGGKSGKPAGSNLNLFGTDREEKPNSELLDE
jgi:hypothetical protein